MSHVVKAVISSIQPVPVAELDKLVALCKSQKIAKGQHFIDFGQIPRKFAFVEQGLFRYYYGDEKGNQFTKGFFPENSMLSSYSCMISQQGSHLAIQALEDSVIQVVDYYSWMQLYNDHACWSGFLVKVLEKAFMKKESREREFLLYDAEKRYKIFLDAYPGMEKRIKQHLIASYLGITSVALSRIRKNMGVVNTG